MARLEGSKPLDVNGAARLLKWHPMTVYTKARKGEIPSYKVGYAVCFDKDEILEFKKQYDQDQTDKRTETQKNWDEQLASQRELQDKQRRRMNPTNPAPTSPEPPAPARKSSRSR